MLIIRLAYKLLDHNKLRLDARCTLYIVVAKMLNDLLPGVDWTLTLEERGDQTLFRVWNKSKNSMLLVNLQGELKEITFNIRNAHGTKTPIQSIHS